MLITGNGHAPGCQHQAGERIEGYDNEGTVGDAQTHRSGKPAQAERVEGKEEGRMTAEEMIDLLCEYHGDMKVSHRVHDPEVYDGDCQYELSYKGIVCGSELVDPVFVRDYIKRHIIPIRG